MNNYWSRKAALGVLSVIVDGMRYATEPTQEDVREWLLTIRRVAQTLDSMLELLPTRGDLERAAREDDAKIGESIATVEIPQ